MVSFSRRGKVVTRVVITSSVSWLTLPPPPICRVSVFCAEHCWATTSAHWSLTWRAVSRRKASGNCSTMRGRLSTLKAVEVCWRGEEEEEIAMSQASSEYISRPTTISSSNPDIVNNSMLSKKRTKL
ncbi:hypothetical protein TYRP_017292 [Tyrophagus putrescentiae]|nr:hypothetical protein TYRP_017292 [Tyrophagus putrescentiae]